jgi:hypothetical protein
LLNVQTVEPLRHADVSILINITVPGQLLPAFSQILLFRDDLFEDFPLVSVQHFVLVLVEIDETPSGRLLLLRGHPRQSVEVLGVVIFQHPSVQELHEVFEENDFFVVGTTLHGPVHVSELVALRRAVLDRSPRNVLSGVFVHAEAISRRFVALDLLVSAVGGAFGDVELPPVHQGGLSVRKTVGGVIVANLGGFVLVSKS